MYVINTCISILFFLISIYTYNQLSFTFNIIFLKDRDATVHDS